LKSEAFAKIDYRIVHPANGDLILKEEFWPADARWILTEFQMSEEGAQRGNVTPRFILTQNKEIIFTTTGNGGWKKRCGPRSWK
jgi:hypothetical protein